MIISHRGFWAVAAGLGSLGNVEAQNHHKYKHNLPTKAQISAPTSVDSSSDATSSPIYFETKWPMLENVTRSFMTGNQFDLSYTVVENSAQLLTTQTHLAMVLLWTNATDGAPVTTENTYHIMSVTCAYLERPYLDRKEVLNSYR
jgi:hypothetical protein